jgi:hypothetical protein
VASFFESPTYEDSNDYVSTTTSPPPPPFSIRRRPRFFTLCTATSFLFSSVFVASSYGLSTQRSTCREIVSKSAGEGVHGQRRITILELGMIKDGHDWYKTHTISKHIVRVQCLHQHLLGIIMSIHPHTPLSAQDFLIGS